MKRQNSALSIILAGSLLLAGCSQAVWAEPMYTAVPIVTPTGLNLNAGTYRYSVGEAGASGAAGLLEIELTVDSNSITNLTIVEASDTQGIQDLVFPILVDQIVSRNTTSVDAVSGGTVTSRRLLTAVEGALLQAGANISDVRALGVGAGLNNFMPGVFHGEASGLFDSEVHLDVFFDLDGVIDVYVEWASEPPRTHPALWETLIDRAIAGGSADIAVVTGATASSRTFIDALQQTVDQAILPIEQPLVGVGNFNFTPGEHTVTVDGVHGLFTLVLTTSNDSILAIDLDHADTPGIVDGPLANTISRILITQDHIVDTVTGATASGHAFANALTQAIELASN